MTVEEIGQLIERRLKLSDQSDKLEKATREIDDALLAELGDKSLDVPVGRFSYRVSVSRTTKTIYRPESVIEALGVGDALPLLTVSTTKLKPVLERVEPGIRKTIEDGAQTTQSKPFIRVSVLR